jgi:hypothetical protein
MKQKAQRRLEAIRRLEATPADFSTYTDKELDVLEGTRSVKRKVTTEAERQLVGVRRRVEAARLREQFGLEGK